MVNITMNKSENLQETFLNQIRKEKSSVTIFLINGVKLQGIITWFDNFSVLLRRDGHTQLVYKHAISTVMSVDTSIQRTATNITIILACCMGHAHVICAVPLPDWSKYARYVSVRLAAPCGPPRSDFGRFLRAY